MKKYFYFVLATFTFMSCTSVKVTKVTKNNSAEVKGVRYALGKPFIQVTPNATGDGSYGVEIVYLPDENQTYAISSSAFFAKNTMEVSVDENGILKKIDWTGTSDTNAADVLKSASEIEKAEQERKKKLNDDAVAAAKAKKKEAEDLVKTLKDALAQKEIELANAKEEESSLVLTYPKPKEEMAEKIRVVKVLVKKLELEVAELKKRLGEANDSLTSASTAFNDPGKSDDKTAWGPVLFAIVETKDKQNVTSLKVEAVHWDNNKKQLPFETATKVDAVAADATIPKFTQTGDIPAKYDDNGSTTVKLTFDSAVKGFKQDQSKFTKIPVTNDGNNPDFNKAIVNINLGKDVSISFKKSDFPAGKYNLDLMYTYTKDGQDIESFASITIILQD
ncbi:MAG: hypothetical protein QM710_14410 [Flavobacterium sp.]